MQTKIFKRRLLHPRGFEAKGKPVSINEGMVRREMQDISSKLLSLLALPSCRRPAQYLWLKQCAQDYRYSEENCEWRENQLSEPVSIV
jgi:hypothetical protein